ncbi:MAG: outer membrane beta-barrel protein [Mariprofundus sp.]|nr:outer membrane beta-barrel protein [Mariprofundus sp.]
MNKMNKSNKAKLNTLFALGSVVLFAGQAMAAGDAGFVPMGPMKLVPVVNVSHEYNDNIFLAEKNKKSSQVTVISPTIALQADSATKSMELSYGLTKSIYYGSRQDDALDHFLNFDVSADLSSRLQTSLGASYDKGHDARGSTFSGTAVTGAVTPDKYHETAVHGAVGYGLRGRIDLVGDYTNKRYDNNRFRTAARDFDTTGGGVSFSFPIMKKTKAVLEARYSKFDYKVISAAGNLNSKEQRYLAGLDWDATAKTSGSLRVGYLRKRFASALNSGSSGLSWELGATWSPLSYSTVDLSTESTTNETDGFGSFIKTKSGNLSWNHAWNSKLSHTLSTGISQDKYIGGIAARTDHLIRAAASLDYQLQRWLNVGASYDYTKRSSGVLNSSYKQNVIAIKLQATL